MTKYPILLTLLLIALISGASQAWLLNSSPYRTPVRVNFSGTYAIPINVTLDATFKADGSDIRCANRYDNATVPCWMQSHVNGSWALIWINDTWSSDNSVQSYLYHGDMSATAAWDGWHTFSNYEDFENYTIAADVSGLNGWTQAAGTLLTTYDLTYSQSKYGTLSTTGSYYRITPPMNASVNGTAHIRMMALNLSAGGPCMRVESTSSGLSLQLCMTSGYFMRRNNLGAWVNLTTPTAYVPGTWYDVEFALTTTSTAILKIDGSVKEPSFGGYATGPGNNRTYFYTTGVPGYIDDLFTTTYYPIDPSYSFDTDESNLGNVTIISPANNSVININGTTGYINYTFTSSIYPYAYCTYVVDNDTLAHSFNYNPIYYSVSDETIAIPLDNNAGRFPNGFYNISIACESGNTFLAQSATNRYAVVNQSYFTSYAVIDAPLNGTNITATQDITYRFLSTQNSFAWCTYVINNDSVAWSFNNNPVYFTDESASSVIPLDNSLGRFVNGQYNISIACADGSNNVLAQSFNSTYTVNNQSYPAAVRIVSPANGSTVNASGGMNITYEFTAGLFYSAWCTYVFDDETVSHAFNHNPVVFTPIITNTTIGIDADTGLLTNGTHIVSMACRNSSGSIVARSGNYTYTLNGSTVIYPLTVAITSPANGSTILNTARISYTLTSYLTDPVICTYHLSTETENFSMNGDARPHVLASPSVNGTPDYVDLYYVANGTYNISILCANASQSVTGISADRQYTVTSSAPPAVPGVAYVTDGLILFIVALISTLVVGAWVYMKFGSMASAITIGVGLIFFSVFTDPPFIPLFVTVIALIGGAIAAIVASRRQ